MDANKNLIIRKSNQLIDAQYSLTLNQQRVILSCIAKIDPWAPRDGSMQEFVITDRELVEITGMGIKEARIELANVVNNLWEQEISLDHGKTKMRWIYRKTDCDRAKAIIQFSPEVYEHLHGLRSTYTQYELMHVAKFRSSYSVRIYEMCARWAGLDKTSVEIEIDTLREQLLLTQKYSRHDDLMKKVINPALADINRLSNLSVKCDEIRIGRAAKRLLFSWCTRDGFADVARSKTKPMPRITDAEIAKSARPGETTGQVINRLVAQRTDEQKKAGLAGAKRARAALSGSHSGEVISTKSVENTGKNVQKTT